MNEETIDHIKCKSPKNSKFVFSSLSTLKLRVCTLSFFWSDKSYISFINRYKTNIIFHI